MITGAGTRAGRIFTGKLLAGGDFLGGDPIIGRLYRAGDILTKGDISIS